MSKNRSTNTSTTPSRVPSAVRFAGRWGRRSVFGVGVLTLAVAAAPYVLAALPDSVVDKLEDATGIAFS